MSLTPVPTSVRTQLLSVCLFGLAFLAGCSSSEHETAVQLTVEYDASWGLDGFEVTVADRSARAAVNRQVRMVVPDALAGTSVEIRLVGLRGSERWATGRTTVTPVRGTTAPASIVLMRIPCGAWCTAGATTCLGDAVVSCAPRASDQCLEWGPPQGCPVATSFCSHGACSATCTDECAEGERRCDGPGALRLCGQSDSDTCLDWGPRVACAAPANEVCASGACRPICQDECTAGETRCFGVGSATCGDLDQNGCTEWGPITPCASGTTCSMGACSATCSDECTAASCQGQTFQQCGQYDLDSCRERSPGISCAPADACLEGQCSSTGCTSMPRVCNQPPATMCIGVNTLRVYDGSGLCDAGGCTYAHREIACANCPSCDPCAGVVCNTPPSPCFAAVGTCAAGSCTYPYANGTTCSDGNSCTTGDQCLTGVCSSTAIACSTPPAPTCMGNVLRTYTGSGACSAGTCSYPFGDATCPGGCSSGACLAACTPGTWTTSTTVDSVGDVGRSMSLMLDATGGVHVSYYDGTNFDLKYAYRSSGGMWTTSTVDSAGDVGQGSSLALDPAGGLHVGYFEVNTGALKYAYRPPGGTWIVSRVDSTGDQVTQPSLALDAAGGVHVSYSESINDDLKYAYRPPGGTWTRSVVDSTGNVGDYSSLALDAAGGVHITYYDATNDDLKYAYRPSGGTWTRSIVDSAGRVGEDGSLALDAAGGAHVAYYQDGNGDYALKYAYRPPGSPGGVWTPVIVDDQDQVGRDASLALDGAGGVHVSYSDWTNGGVKYAYLASGGAWAVSTVHVGSLYLDTSVAVDAAGGVHLSSFYERDKDLKYAYRCPP